MADKHKKLTARQLTMMALGSVIGGSFFLGSSVAIHAAGPAIIISFILGGILSYFILAALSEMITADTCGGSFHDFAKKAFGPGVGFVVGWVYWTGMVLAMSSEAVAVSIFIRNWFPGIPVFLMGSIIIIGVTLLNLSEADKLSRLESGLAAVKILAIAVFIIISLLIITGVMPGLPRMGAGELAKEPLIPGGIKSIAGSMLIVIFSYAGFEIISLAASETDNPAKTIPKANFYTVISLAGLYILSIIVLLPLIPTAVINEEISPMVAALERLGIGWAGKAINFVLITAILSTMLAAVFGLGRMIRSITENGQGPVWLKDKTEVPARGILFSGFSMLAGLSIGHMFPEIYLFLISSGGFAMIFTYSVIIASHIRLRKKYGYKLSTICIVPGYPYTSWIALLSLIVIILSMPLIPGQAPALIIGLIIIVFYSTSYIAVKYYKNLNKPDIMDMQLKTRIHRARFLAEFSKELNAVKKELKKK